MSRILPSKIRKKFNRTDFNGNRLNLSDLVRTPEGTIGQYYGISIPRPRSQFGVPIKYGIPSKLIVLLYKTDEEEDVKGKTPRTLPECFDYNRKLIPISYSITSRDITPRDNTYVVPVGIPEESTKPKSAPFSWSW